MTSPSRVTIVAAACGWLGTPYRHQASLKGVGADCLGLVRGVWREVYGAEPESMPAYTPDWAEARGSETLQQAAARHMVPVDPASAMPGDLLLFRWQETLPAKHAAILVAPGRFLHAHDGATVAEASLTPWWARRLAFAFAFPPIVPGVPR